MLPAQGCLPSHHADKAPACQKSCSTSRYRFCWQLAGCQHKHCPQKQLWAAAHSIKAIRPGGSLCWLPAMQT